MFNISKELIIVSFISAFFFLIPMWFFWLIMGKAGYSRWWSLVVLIPYVGVWILLAFLAFNTWPAIRSVARTTPAVSGEGS